MNRPSVCIFTCSPVLFVSVCIKIWLQHVSVWPQMASVQGHSVARAYPSLALDYSYYFYYSFFFIIFNTLFQNLKSSCFVLLGISLFWQSKAEHYPERAALSCPNPSISFPSVQMSEICLRQYVCWCLGGKHSWINGPTVLFSFDCQHHQRWGQDKASQHKCTVIFPRKQKDIYIGPERSLYLLITPDALISVFALFCGLLLRIALHQNIMDLAGHSAVLTDHSQWAEDSRWPYTSREHQEGFLRPRQSFVWRQMRTH